MSAVALCEMTRERLHAFYRAYENDPALFMDMDRFEPFVYRPEWVNARFDAHRQQGRKMFAVMLGEWVIGELELKQIDREARTCVLGIALQNDAVKEKGYGTEAERQALCYAFDVLDMQTVYADAVHRNVRSQHVLEKVGFRFVREDGAFRYYECTKSNFEARILSDGTAADGLRMEAEGNRPARGDGFTA